MHQENCPPENHNDFIGAYEFFRRSKSFLNDPNMFTAFYFKYRLSILGGVLLAFLLLLSGLHLFWRVEAVLLPWNVLLALRLPRLLTAAAVGAILALAGAVMQAQFRNPLAEPTLIGISGGASLGAALALSLQLSAFSVILAAFSGALLANLLAQYWAGKGAASRLLLAGVAINALCSAALSMLLLLIQDQDLRGLLFWLMGSFASTSWQEAAILWLVLGVSLLIFLPRARALDCLLLGEQNARFAGIETKKLSIINNLSIALGVGLAASLVGMIAFIGLMVPHILRRLGAGRAQCLLPLSALGGAVLALLADLLAQLLTPPLDLPVGALISLLGAPFLLWILQYRKEEE